MKRFLSMYVPNHGLAIVDTAAVPAQIVCYVAQVSGGLSSLFFGTQKQADDDAGLARFIVDALNHYAEIGAAVNAAAKERK